MKVVGRSTVSDATTYTGLGAGTAVAEAKFPPLCLPGLLSKALTRVLLVCDAMPQEVQFILC